MLHSMERLQREGSGRFALDVEGFEHRKQANTFAQSLELLCDFERNCPPETIAPEIIRSLRLGRPDLLDVLGSHALDAPLERFSAVQPRRLQPVEPQLGPEPV